MLHSRASQRAASLFSPAGNSEAAVMFAIFLNSLRRLTGSVLSGGLLLLLAAPSQALTVYKYVDQNGVVTYSDQAVAGAQVFVFRDRMVERLDLQVKLETKKHAAGETLLVRNDLYAPVEIKLQLNDVVNAVGAPDKPISWVLPPRSKIQIARQKKRSWRLCLGIHTLSD